MMLSRTVSSVLSKPMPSSGRKPSFPISSLRERGSIPEYALSSEKDERIESSVIPISFLKEDFESSEAERIQSG